jgi:hypothetical protein
MRVFQDDLPTVRIPYLRASGAITPETSAFSVHLGGVEKTVSVTLQRFPNGGSWSLFLCPQCGRKARALRLLRGEVLCRRCCVAGGVRFRCEPMGLRQRAEHRALKLRVMLQSEQSLRLKPCQWGKMERRVRLQAALHKAELLIGHTDFVKPKPGET